MSSTQAIRIQRLKDKSQMAFDLESDFVLSPCIGVCEVHTKAQVCVGCYRTLEEIVRWTSYALPEKRAIWTQIMARIQAPEYQRF
jgi:predicted Fe-S protein YdhL (DUF1289 family)